MNETAAAMLRGASRLLDITGQGRTRHDYSPAAQLARVADTIARAQKQATGQEGHGMRTFTATYDPGKFRVEARNAAGRVVFVDVAHGRYLAETALERDGFKVDTEWVTGADGVRTAALLDVRSPVRRIREFLHRAFRRR